jgi:hypothetical protein
MSAPIATTPSLLSEGRVASKASGAANGGRFGDALGSALLDAAGSSEDRQQPGLAALTAVALSLAKPATEPQASGAKPDLGLELVLAPEWQPDQDGPGEGQVGSDLGSATDASAPDKGAPRQLGTSPAAARVVTADIPLTLEKGLELWVRRITREATERKAEGSADSDPAGEGAKPARTGANDLAAAVPGPVPVPVSAGPGQDGGAGRTAEPAPDAPSTGSEPLWLGQAAGRDALASRAASRDVAGPLIRPTADGGLDAESLIQAMAPKVHAVEIAGFSFPMPREPTTPVAASISAASGADQALPPGAATPGQGQVAGLAIETGRSAGHDADPRRDGRSGDRRDGARPELGAAAPTPGGSTAPGPAAPIHVTDAAPRSLATALTVATGDPRPVATPEPARALPRMDQVTVDLKDEAGDHGRLRLTVQGSSLRATILPNDPELATRLNDGLRELRQNLSDQGFAAPRISVQAPRAGDAVPGLAPVGRDASPVRLESTGTDRQSSSDSRRDPSQQSAEQRRQGGRSPDRQTPGRQQRGRWA